MQYDQIDPLAQALITLKQGANPTTPKGDPTVAGQTMAAVQPQQPQMPPQAGLPGMLPQRGQPSQMPPQMSPQMSPQGGRPQPPGIAGIAQNVARGNAMQQQQQQEAEQAMRQKAMAEQQAQPQMMAAGGLAGLPARNMNFIAGGVVPGIAAPELPPEVETPEQKQLVEQQRRYEELQKNRPDFTAQFMAALDADKQAREKIAATQAANAPDLISRLGAYAADYVQGGASGALKGVRGRQKEAIDRMEATRQADKLDMLERVKLQQADYAMKIGEVDKAREFIREAADIRGKNNQLRQTEFGTRAKIFGDQERSVSGTADRASTEARSQADREARGMESKADRESRERIARMQIGAGGAGGAGGVGAGRLDLAEYKALAEPLEKELVALSGGLQRGHAPDVARAQKIYADLEFLRKVYGLPAGVGAPLGVPNGAAPVPSSASGAPKAGKFLGFE